MWTFFAPSAWARASATDSGPDSPQRGGKKAGGPRRGSEKPSGEWVGKEM